MKIVFRPAYFLLTVLLFLIEFLIAAYVNDRFFRPYFGDYLVVIMLYSLIRTFFSIRAIPAAISVLLFAFAVEFTQYFHLIDYLGLKDSKLTRAIIGGSFDRLDLLAYTLGILTVVLLERPKAS